MVIFPSPFGSSTIPIRGKNFLYCGQFKLFPQEYCESPGNAKPAGGVHKNAAVEVLVEEALVEVGETVRTC